MKNEKVNGERRGNAVRFSVVPRVAKQRHAFSAFVRVVAFVSRSKDPRAFG